MQACPIGVSSWLAGRLACGPTRPRRASCSRRPAMVSRAGGVAGRRSHARRMTSIGPRPLSRFRCQRGRWGVRIAASTRIGMTTMAGALSQGSGAASRVRMLGRTFTGRTRSPRRRALLARPLARVLRVPRRSACSGRRRVAACSEARIVAVSPTRVGCSRCSAQWASAEIGRPTLGEDCPRCVAVCVLCREDRRPKEWPAFIAEVVVPGVGRISQVPAHPSCVRSHSKFISERAASPGQPIMERCGGSGSHTPFANVEQGGCGCCPDCCGMDSRTGRAATTRATTGRSRLLGRRLRWVSHGYQWACVKDGDAEGCDGSGGGFESRPYAEVAAEARAHRKATGHPVQIDEMRARLILGESSKCPVRVTGEHTPAFNPFVASKSSCLDCGRELTDASSGG